MKIDIGIASYKSPEKLRRTIHSVQRLANSDWSMLIAHNPSPGDEAVLELIYGAMDRDKRIRTVSMNNNIGYAGAVSYMMAQCLDGNFLRNGVKGDVGAGGKDWSHFLYLDNDVQIQTPGFDERLCRVFDQVEDAGMVFPNTGVYPMHLPDFDGYASDPLMEVMWSPGFCFAVTRKVLTEVGYLDTSLGHQEEADYALRVRMAGYRCIANPIVVVGHDATATSDPASQERINKGVVAWVDKWNRYFNGKQYGYHHKQVTRWEDWPPNALYLERWYMEQGVELNGDPKLLTIKGREYDLIEVPRFKGFYRRRII